MDSSGGLSARVVGAIGKIGRATWDGLANPANAPFDPFVAYDFLAALEESSCVSEACGWTPAHVSVSDEAGVRGVAPLYIKDHSYGEYVFDHAWADGLHRAGGRYYPKLQCAVPFTPVPGRRLFALDARAQDALGQGLMALVDRGGFSSAHVTFAPEAQCDRLAGQGYLQRTGLQYHWFNRGYGSFDDFLATLSSQKRKNIKKERARAQAGVRVRRLEGADITSADWDFFFRCYMDTGSRKWGSPYLNRAFFEILGARMGASVILFIAEQDGRAVASALNFLGADALYGRYWGRIADIPFLHFELCYYQAIDVAIERGLARVEAGAQGEHKLARGYEPVTTHSAHYIAHAGFRAAVARYLAAETPAVLEEREVLDAHTPFKKGE